VVHDPAQMPGYYTKALLDKPLLGRIEDSAADMLASFLVRAADSHDDIRGCKGLESLLVTGVPTTRIVEVAKQRGVTMIVMGSQGRTGLKHLMTGSVAEQVIRLSPVPVTVVKS
jgi:nucleotide-binding universal stress UspA family protein